MVNIWITRISFCLISLLDGQKEEHAAYKNPASAIPMCSSFGTAGLIWSNSVKVKRLNHTHSGFCLTGPFLWNYSRLVWSLKVNFCKLLRQKVNFWELLWQNFDRQDDLPVAQPTASKHWRMKRVKPKNERSTHSSIPELQEYTLNKTLGKTLKTN